jgi:hypothetical protein
MAPACQTRGRSDKSYVTHCSLTRPKYKTKVPTKQQQKGLDAPVPDRAPYSLTSQTPIDLKPANLAGLGDAMRAQPVDHLAPEVTGEGLRHRVIEIYWA